jgi:hypothetical protein
MTTYLVLSQQRFNPNCVDGPLHRCNTFGPHAGLNQNLFYNEPLYLSIDLTHFLFKGIRYNIRLKSIQKLMAKHHTNAEAGTKNIVDAHFKKYIYDVDVLESFRPKVGTDLGYPRMERPAPPRVPEEQYFVIVQVKDNNTYLHNRFEFNHVVFEGMRFELIF